MGLEQREGSKVAAVGPKICAHAEPHGLDILLTFVPNKTNLLIVKRLAIKMTLPVAIY
jgi:hypothetical protein